MKLKYFISACFLTGVLLLQSGAPVLAVAAGIGVAVAGQFLLRRKNVKPSGNIEPACHSNKIRQGLRPHLARQIGAVNLHGHFAGANDIGDLLVGFAGNDKSQ